MIGNILGAMVCIGLLGLSTHYFGIELIGTPFLALMWALVITPILFVFLVIIIDSLKLNSIGKETSQLPPNKLSGL